MHGHGRSGDVLGATPLVAKADGDGLGLVQEVVGAEADVGEAGPGKNDGVPHIFGLQAARGPGFPGLRGESFAKPKRVLGVAALRDGERAQPVHAGKSKDVGDAFGVGVRSPPRDEGPTVCSATAAATRR